MFDGLLPEPHNQAILSLLFTCAHWHGLAKLRMHTDPTLDILDNVTVQLGTEFRAFTNKTCPAFNTRELRRETESRNHRKRKKGNGGQNQAPIPTASEDEPRKKTFNLERYKHHVLGDYAATIRQYGTTDSYSTEPVGANVRISHPTTDHLCRVSLSIVNRRLGTSAWQKLETVSSSSWLVSSVVRLACVVSE